MVKPGKKPSKGRQKIEIRRIKDKAKHQVTLCKRKGGILKKCSELQLPYGAHVAVAILLHYVDHVLRRFAPLPGDEVGLLLPAGAERRGGGDGAGGGGGRGTREGGEGSDERRRGEGAAGCGGRRKLFAVLVGGRRGGARGGGAAGVRQGVREIVQREADKLRASAPPAVAAAPWHL